jgi:hypothetical protein
VSFLFLSVPYKLFLHVIRNINIFVTWENPGRLASRTEFYGTPEQSSLKPTKIGTTYFSAVIMRGVVLHFALAPSWHCAELRETFTKSE